MNFNISQKIKIIHLPPQEKCAGGPKLPDNNLTPIQLSYYLFLFLRGLLWWLSPPPLS